MCGRVFVEDVSPRRSQMKNEGAVIDEGQSIIIKLLSDECRLKGSVKRGGSICCYSHSSKRNGPTYGYIITKRSPVGNYLILIIWYVQAYLHNTHVSSINVERRLNLLKYCAHCTCTLLLFDSFRRVHRTATLRWSFKQLTAHGKYGKLQTQNEI